jgi:hypothetical protein
MTDGHTTNLESFFQVSNHSFGITYYMSITTALVSTIVCLISLNHVSFPTSVSDYP